MKNLEIQSKIQTDFRKIVEKDKRVKNAFLLVHSDKLNISFNIAEGETDGMPANNNQANYLASVGKLFTATVIGILYEKGELDYNDSISKYLDSELLSDLHIYKAKNYTDDITIRHLLMQTSGLNDVFYHLWKKMVADRNFRITPREAVVWGKENLKPVATPGKKHYYTDTNYYLLGLIVEKITKMKFHEAMHELVFDPLEMNNAYMYSYSKPKIEQAIPPARIFIQGVDVFTLEGVHQIDYAGGGVMAPLEDFLKFMQALVRGKIIRQDTLSLMINDDISMGFPTIAFNYGYSIWKPKTIPIILPEKYNCWGCVGVTGAFMFFHPLTESYIIGSFHDFSYRGKALEFMIKKVIKQLLMIN